MSNKAEGSKFEKEFLEKCNQEFSGIWGHIFQDKANGQPVDVIMAKNGTAVLIDCKVCSNDTFEFSRIENNQRNAIERWYSTGNIMALIACKMSDGTIKLIDWYSIIDYENMGYKRMNKEDLIIEGMSIKQMGEFLGWM